MDNIVFVKNRKEYDLLEGKFDQDNTLVISKESFSSKNKFKTLVTKNT